MKCCKTADNNITCGSEHWYYLAYDEFQTPLYYCPFCGKMLADRSPGEDRKPRRLYVTFDVDGVLCDDSDTTQTYAERVPYPWVSRRLKGVRLAGHCIIVQTARYMRAAQGDQATAENLGLDELVAWLDRHDIPYDRVYMGKASSDIFVDDRAFHLNSNDGEAGWDVLSERLEYMARRP